MESSSGVCNEPEVGILLDLGSPFSSAVKAMVDCLDTSEATKTAGGDSANIPACKPDDDLEDTPIQDEQPAKCSTDRSSQDTSSSQESSNWADLADEHLIDSEQFDFDLPLSPLEIAAKVEVDDEDEVFFGPVGFTESCVAKKTQLNSQSLMDCKPLSPLNVEQYLELFLEANKVAMELAGREKSDSPRGSEDQNCKASKETETADGNLHKLEHSKDIKSETEQVLGFQAESSDGLASLPRKPEVRNFKRLVRKEMRSPRRGTYTISVSPANTPPPPHLPSADWCMASLTIDKPKTMQFNDTGSQEHHSLKAPQRESKLPVKENRRSKLPMKGGMKRAVPPPKPSCGMTTDKLLQKKMSSPPKRKRLNSCESEDMISEAGSSVASETSETPNLSTGIPKGKRPQPRSFHPKGPSGVRPSGIHTTPSSGSAQRKSTINTAAKTTGAATSTCSLKAPTAKPSLLQQGTLQRRTVQTSRPLKLVKPGQRGSLQLTSKPQPLKAVPGVAKVSKNDEAATGVTPQKAVSMRETLSRKPSTPSTPVHLDKKVVPKRLLTRDQSTSKPAPRSLSSSSVPTPQSKMIPPSTPSCSDSKRAPTSAGSARRRSAIPTPSRRTVASTSRLNSTSSIVSNPSPMLSRAQRTSSDISSPSSSLRFPKPGPRPAKEGAIKLDLDSSPACSKETNANGGRTVLETRTNVLEVEKSSPAVGLLIDFNPDAQDRKASVTQGNTRNNKENLIDLL